MSEGKTEITRNFAPSLPTTLNKSQGGMKDRVQGFFSRAIGQETGQPSGDVQKRTQELFNLLVDRVELRIDIRRQSEVSGQTGAKPKEMTVKEKIDLIKRGGVKVVGNQLKGAEAGTTTLEADLKKLRETDEKISELTKDTKVVEQYAKFRKNRVEKLKRAKEVTDSEEAIKQLKLQQEKMARAAFLQGRQYSPGERQMIDDNKLVAQAIKDRVDQLKKDTEVFDLVRLRQLQEYQKGLKKDRFAETPSRANYIDAVRSYWAQGKKVLLTGSTGGGKTELLLHASRSLFGTEAERLTGHELMTNYEVYGKTKGGVSPEGHMTLMFGAAPFIRSVEDNKPFVFDEINAVPNRVLMRLKTDLNARYGQEVTVQEDGDKRMKIGDRHAIGATMNVKSEKYIDREKLDPAIVRMFEPLAIDYFPPQELYDIMLASMMDVQGGVKLSVKDANDTLKALSDATEWVQMAYLGRTVQTGSSTILEARGQGTVGKPATLQEAVLDPGKAVDMLSGWEDAEKSGLTFKEFLNGKIVAFINNENYPEEDRYYLTEIFALQGFLKGVKASDLRVAGLNQGILDGWSGYDGKRYVSKSNYTPPEVVAKLDPYGALSRPVGVEAKDLLDEELVVEVSEENPVVTGQRVQTQTSTTQVSVGRKPAPPPIPSAAGLSPDTAFRISAIDIQYDPNNITAQMPSKKYDEYPKSLVEVVKLDPNAWPEISTRLNKILDSAISDANMFSVRDLSGYIYYFANAVRANRQALLEVAKFANKIENMSAWNNSGYDTAKQVARKDLGEIRNIIMSIGAIS